jgi:hypothetical protein
MQYWRQSKGTCQPKPWRRLKPVDVGGYYLPNDKLASVALRPSKTLNEILAQL